MEINFNADTVYSESSEMKIYVEITTNTGEADTIFNCIKDHVDHEAMMNCLTEEEVIEYFGIGEDNV